MQDRTEYEPGKSFDPEWATFLNELRTALPGVQLLFGFLLVAPYSSRFQDLTGPARLVFFACFLCTTAACAFLIAPSVYHRLHWRRDVRDKEEMFQTCNRLAIISGVLLAAVFVVSSFIMNTQVAWLATASALAGFGWLWFGLPLSRRQRERQRS